MKISHTLIHEGISYGIPEGTKVPKKPKYKQKCETRKINSIECDTTGGECTCEIDWQTYNADLKALLSVAIRWEDQRMIKSWLPDNAFITDADGDCVTTDGIYPLLGVEAERVEQYCYLEYSEKQISQWFDGSPSQSAKCKLKKRRSVLRLIPQPNSEEKKQWPESQRPAPPEVEKAVEYALKKSAKVGGSEVSEKIANHDCSGGNWSIVCYCPQGICRANEDKKKRKVGVDEKKEPETEYEYCENYLKGDGCPVEAHPGEICTCCLVDLDGKWKGVSEKEPTQEELLEELSKHINIAMDGSDAEIDTDALKYFHIQKLKP